MPPSPTKINDNAWSLIDDLIRDAESLRVYATSVAEATVVDCGVDAKGGLAAGIRMAQLCTSGLGSIHAQAGRNDVWSGVDITIASDFPVMACMGSQYAGWSLSVEADSGNYFAMASGPMRAARGKEEILDHLGISDKANCAVGVLESGSLPPESAVRDVADACGLPPERIALAVAPTASIAGSVQVVSRSVETALHKLEQLGFDLRRVVSGFGAAPLPPVAKNDLAAIGRTNDAVLYGGEATLWVTGDDDSLRELGEKTPSSASADFGEPFAEVFARYDYDFYKVDPLLFSPARVTFNNVETGRVFRFGAPRPDVLEKSFGVS